MTSSGSAVAETRSAAATARPDEPPTSRPSSRASRLVIANESASLIAITSSATFRSKVAGQMSSPTPSTR